MRISTNAIIDPYERALNASQSNKLKAQLRLSSGKDIVELADDPKRFVHAKNLSNLIDRNTTYKDNINAAIDEFAVVDDQLRSLSDKMQYIRENAIDATITGSTGNLHSLGILVKGVLADIVKDANLDFNGHFVFSGTQTTMESMTPIGTPENPYPFELVEETPSDGNPSGLKVLFKGNNNERKINKDEIHTETVNVTANEIFGDDGTEIFEAIIGLYNLMAFKADGSKREQTDVFNTDDITKLDGFQKKIADQILQVNNASSIVGAKYKMLDNLRLQMDNEELLLKDFLSKDQDTDIARATLDLKKYDNAVQYTLQTGSAILNQSLFDFLK